MSLFTEDLKEQYKNIFLRSVLLSGDWIPLTLPDKIRDVFINSEVISLGGATEASIWSIYYPIKSIDSKMHHITTYIGIEGNGFVCVGNANDLDAPGAIFSYQSYVREHEAMLPYLIDIFETNTGVK